MSVTLSDLNRFSKFLHCQKAYEICYNIKPLQNYPPHIRLHYLGKLKIQIFCRYSVHMENNANKSHFECTVEYPSSVIFHGTFQQLINTMLCPAFLRKFVCQPVCCISLQIQTFYQNLVFIAEHHVDY